MHTSNTPDDDHPGPPAFLPTAPQIHTDDHGRHRDTEGREYVAVTLGGELTYVPVAGPFDRAPLVDVEVGRALLAEAVVGLPLGEYDRRILVWVGTWDGPTIAVLASLLARAPGR